MPIENEEIKQITIEEIKAVRDELKKMNSKWAADMNKKLFSNKADFIVNKEYYLDKIYNIVHGSIRSQEIRGQFVIAAAELISSFREHGNQASNAIQKIFNS